VIDTETIRLYDGRDLARNLQILRPPDDQFFSPGAVFLRRVRDAYLENRQAILSEIDVDDENSVVEGIALALIPPDLHTQWAIYADLGLYELRDTGAGDYSGDVQMGDIPGIAWHACNVTAQMLLGNLGVDDKTN